MATGCRLVKLSGVAAITEWWHGIRRQPGASAEASAPRGGHAQYCRFPGRCSAEGRGKKGNKALDDLPLGQAGNGGRGLPWREGGLDRLSFIHRAFVRSFIHSFNVAPVGSQA